MDSHPERAPRWDSLQALYVRKWDSGRWGDQLGQRMRVTLDLADKHWNGGRPRVLDIGCGVGLQAVQLGRRLGASTVQGVDISEVAVAEARVNGISSFALDLNRENLPFQDASFDVIHCGEVLEHVVDPDRLLEELRRLLSAEGLLLLSFSNLAAWFNRLALLVGWQPPAVGSSLWGARGAPRMMRDLGHPDHLHAFTKRSAVEALADASFRVLECRGTAILERGIRRNWRRSEVPYLAVMPLDLLLSTRPSLAAHIVIAARAERGGRPTLPRPG